MEVHSTTTLVSKYLPTEYLLAFRSGFFNMVGGANLGGHRLKLRGGSGQGWSSGTFGPLAHL